MKALIRSLIAILFPLSLPYAITRAIFPPRSISDFFCALKIKPCGNLRGRRVWRTKKRERDRQRERPIALKLFIRPDEIHPEHKCETLRAR